MRGAFDASKGDAAEGGASDGPDPPLQAAIAASMVSAMISAKTLFINSPFLCCFHTVFYQFLLFFIQRMYTIYKFERLSREIGYSVERETEALPAAEMEALRTVALP